MFAGVVGRDLVLERRGNQDVHVQRIELLVGQLLGAGEPVHGVVLRRPLDQLLHVEPGLVVDAALPVGDRDDAAPELVNEVSRHRARRSRTPGSRRLPAARLSFRCAAASRVQIMTPRPVASRRPFRPAENDRLAGDDGGFGAADVHGVGVHDPRHDLLVRVDVRRGHVLVGADGIDDLGHVAAGERLELAPRHARRVADHAALAAAERDVGDRALPGHPRGERRHLVERHVGMKADAALRRAERDVVLHAVPGEHLDLTAVHLHRTRHGDLPLGPRQNFPDAGLEVEDARRSVELLEHGTEDRPVCRHGCVLVARARSQAGAPRIRYEGRWGRGHRCKRPNVLPAQQASQASSCEPSG